jgi:hypothetical protein
MFSSEKHRKISFWIIGTLAVFTSFLASAYFFGAITSNPAGPNFTFRLDSNQQFQGRLWFSIRPIIHFMVLFVTELVRYSYVLYQLHA